MSPGRASVVARPDFDDIAKRTTSQGCVDGLAELLEQCKGIQVLDSLLVPDDEFSFRAQTLSKVWDWDWMSNDDDLG